MISIIVSLYNNKEYIEKCLTSIVSQGYKNIEIIVVNDGSTDESLDIVTNFSKNDSRIQIINRKNGGLSAARNTGIEYSTGEFLIFVDGDDELENNAIENLYNAIESHNADIAIGSISVVYEAHEELKSSDSYYYSIKYNKCLYINDDIIDNIHCSACAKIYRRSIIDKYNLRFPEGLLYEDAYWHWVYLSSSKIASLIKYNVYKYYRHKKSIMSSTFDCEKNLSIQHLYIVEKIFEFWINNKMFDEHYKIAPLMLEKYFWLAFRYAKKFEKVKAIYECERIATQYSLNIDSNSIINKICNGNIAFLFPQNMYNDIYYSRYLQIMEAINKFLPIDSRRRKWLYNIARYLYRYIKK